MVSGGQINSFVFIDLETTGLPFLDKGGNRTRLTEVAFISVPRKSFCSPNGQLPRAVNKISFLANPKINVSKLIGDITGLDSLVLDRETPFDSKKAQMLKSFLDILKPPVCLVAHNGRKFDFPILRFELIQAGESFSDEILCADSLPAFRNIATMPIDETQPVFSPFITSSDLECVKALEEIEKHLASPNGTDDIVDKIEQIRQLNETTPQSQIIGRSIQHGNLVAAKRRLCFGSDKPVKKALSFKLPDIYERMFGCKPREMHRAEHDSVTLAQCCLKHGHHIVNWFDSNSVKFNSVTPTYNN